MWSHYADEHRGICIEYDTRDQNHPRLDQINYKAPRAVKTSDLWRWKARNDDKAKKRVIDTYFYSKSSEWRYEKEWRDVSEKSGVKGVPFRITALLFGLRWDFPDTRHHRHRRFYKTGRPGFPNAFSRSRRLSCP